MDKANSHDSFDKSRSETIDSYQSVKVDGIVYNAEETDCNVNGDGKYQNTSELSKFINEGQDNSKVKSAYSGQNCNYTKKTAKTSETEIGNGGTLEENTEFDHRVSGFETFSEEKRSLIGEQEEEKRKVNIDEGEEAEKGSSDVEDEKGLPIDHGYAWVIVAGSFLNLILMVGYGRGIAILFVEYITIFEASVSTTTLFMGVMGGSYSIGALFSMHMILGMLGVRKTVLLGATLNVVGMITAIFARSLVFLICTHSIIIGVSHSMIHGPGLVIIGHYFKKRRGMAMTVATSAVSLAGIIFPPLVRFLLDTYALRGTMIILTGLSMNIWVGAMLFRPLESWNKEALQKTASKDDKEKQSVLVQLKKAFSHMDFTLFKIRTFQYIMCFSPLAILVALNSAYVPVLAKEKGVSETDGALLLTIMSSLDFVSRLSVGAVVDRGYIKVYNLMAIGLLIIGTMNQFTMFYNSYALLVMFSVVNGIFGSFYMCLLAVGIVEFMGVENMAKVIGFVSLFQGMSAFITHPILGTIRDYTGSYTICFNYVGACAFVGAILLFLAPLVLPKKPTEDKQQQDDI